MDQRSKCWRLIQLLYRQTSLAGEVLNATSLDGRTSKLVQAVCAD
jgi:hypothetical protein